MSLRRILEIALASVLIHMPAMAQEAAERPQITLGNGSANMIQIDGMTRQVEPDAVTHIRIDGDQPTLMRANATSITFARVLAADAGWLVLHPIIDGKPDGDIVSGFAQVEAGENSEVTIRMQHPASAGDKYLVMLHRDVSQDRVFDFVFVADGINVEDTAVFEGKRMIAHLIALPD